MIILMKKRTALKIEYHYAQISRLTKKLNKAPISKRRDLNGEINLHKLYAANLSKRYEIAAGLRDSDGRFIA